MSLLVLPTYLICLLIYHSPRSFGGRKALENCGFFPPMGRVGSPTTAAPQGLRSHMLALSPLIVPALRPVALPPSFPACPAVAP